VSVAAAPASHAAAIGILGGTFDPVHCGHLRLALEVRATLGLAEVRLMPASNPRLRAPPRAAADNRLAMLECAVADCPGLNVDARELSRPGPTSTVDTLESLRAELPDRSLCLILGMDAFARIEAWHRWREIFDLAHLVVVRRPGSPDPGGDALAELLVARRCRDFDRLHDEPAGRIAVLEVPGLDISGSRIRALVAGRADIRFLVPDAVAALINERGLYAES